MQTQLTRESDAGQELIMWKERRIESLPCWPKGVRLPIIISPHHQSEEMSSLYPDGQPDGFACP